MVVDINVVGNEEGCYDRVFCIYSGRRGYMHKHYGHPKIETTLPLCAAFLDFMRSSTALLQHVMTIFNFLEFSVLLLWVGSPQSQVG